MYRLWHSLIALSCMVSSVRVQCLLSRVFVEYVCVGSFQHSGTHQQPSDRQVRLTDTLSMLLVIPNLWLRTARSDTEGQLIGPFSQSSPPIIQTKTCYNPYNVIKCWLGTVEWNKDNVCMPDRENPPFPPTPEQLSVLPRQWPSAWCHGPDGMPADPPAQDSAWP